MPVVIAGTEEQKKKYLGRMIEEPLMCVSVQRYFLSQINNIRHFCVVLHSRFSEIEDRSICRG